MIFPRFRNLHRNVLKFIPLPAVAKFEALKDLRGVPSSDPGPTISIRGAVRWLARAQDSSSSRDGGVARHYSLLSGWGPSYPETTGYIIPTLLRYAEDYGDGDLAGRTNRMLDWLVSIQLQEGGFQAGTVEASPAAPTPFNTGQILLGLAEGVRTIGSQYKRPMQRAADWLVKNQDPDGCWRKFPTPFAAQGEKTYDTHAAWGLFEAAEVDGNEDYLRAGMANIYWAMGHQRENGWFEKCCLLNPSKPLTHTIGYAFRGLLEAYRHSPDPNVLNACTRIAEGLLGALQEDGFLPGRLNSDWKGTDPWVCLTGSAQIAYCWFIMHELSREERYLNAALSINRYLRKTQVVSETEETHGAIKGSFPVFGSYGAYEYLSWAAKFFVDTNTLELAIKNGSRLDQTCEKEIVSGLAV